MEEKGREKYNILFTQCLSLSLLHTSIHRHTFTHTNIIHKFHTQYTKANAQKLMIFCGIVGNFNFLL